MSDAQFFCLLGFVVLMFLCAIGCLVGDSIDRRQARERNEPWRLR